MPINRITGRESSIQPLLGPDDINDVPLHGDNFEVVGPTVPDQAHAMLSPYHDYDEFIEYYDEFDVPIMTVETRLPTDGLLRTFVIGLVIGLVLAMLLRW